MGETRRRSTEPRLTLVSFKICSKLSLNTLDNHFIPFLTGQQSSQLRSMPKNCAFYTNDGNLRKSWAFLDIVYYKSNSFYYFSAERLWQGLYRRKKQNKSGKSMCLTSIFRKVPLFPSLILMPFHHLEEKAKISAFQSKIFSITCCSILLQGLRQCYVSLRRI